MIVARRARRCCKKSRNQAGDVISYNIPVPDSGSSSLCYYQPRFPTCLAPYHYADIAKAFLLASSITQPPPPVPVKWIADWEVWDRCEGVSERDGESSPDSLACGMRAAIGEHSTGLGICVIVAVPGRIGASAPYLPIGVYITKPPIIGTS